MNKVENYFSFLSSQLLHMQWDNYALLAVSFVIQLVILFSQPVTWLTTVTFIGTMLGVSCVSAINASKSVNGVLGILSGVCFIITGLNAKNYLTICEQVSYMLTLDLPVLINHDWNKDLASKIRKFTGKDWVISLAFTLGMTIVSALAIGKLTNDPRPWIDAVSFAVSLTGGIVCYKRFNNQYFWWTFGGAFQIVLWMITWRQGGASPAMLMNYLIYFSNDILAFTLSPWFNAKTRARVIAKNHALEAENK